MIHQIMDFLSSCDPEVGAAIQKEHRRQQENLEVIASENIVSEAVTLIAFLRVPILSHILRLDVAID